MMKIKKLDPNATLPTQGSPYAAGYDLYACKDCAIEPGQTVLVHTGLAMEITDGWWGGIYARSGLATKQGLRPANCVGVIDSDYRGEVMVALHNDSDYVREIKCGDRVAQLVFHQQWTTDWEVVDELSDTTRGEGGFGSTGKN